MTENDPFEERAKTNKLKKEIEAALDGKPIISKKKKKRQLLTTPTPPHNQSKLQKLQNTEK